MTTEKEKNTRILFIHPDLGIGGAERLVVDAALALKKDGHQVSFLTNHHDPSHCFEETKNGLLDVEVVGDWLPRNIFGKFYAFCAYFRMLYATIYAVMIKKEKVDVFFIDQISIGIPIIKMFMSNFPKVLFYCHFPDQLLSKRGSILKDFYRYPINYLEEKTTGQADCIIVNSKFTEKTFFKTFKTLKNNVKILYPSIVTKNFDLNLNIKDPIVKLDDNVFVFLSINRYERKKNLNLALQSLKLFDSNMKETKIHLIMAGGYDKRVTENIEHFEELQNLCSELGLTTKVTFLKSPSDTDKCWLLERCQCLIYTPENEHFGIVPLEAMYMKKPVIAVNSGGPTETVRQNETGFCCDPNVVDFANAMMKLVNNRTLMNDMGNCGRARFDKYFSYESFCKNINKYVKELIDLKQAEINSSESKKTS